MLRRAISRTGGTAMSLQRKTLVVLLLALIVGGSVAGSKKTDVDILTRVGRVAAQKVTAVMPDTSALAGPLVALTPPDLMPVADRVRLRIKMDKVMDGATVTVSATADGVVTLRGEMRSTEQRVRAMDLAQSTAGVTGVVNEMPEPAK
jgi:hypothetical protein